VLVGICVRRLVRNVCGFTLLGAGVAMIVLPGPGWLTIALGLGLLAADFPWAEATLARLKRGSSKLRDRLKRER
jgi:uncharacterized protein (TIGR02611 family)